MTHRPWLPLLLAALLTLAALPSPAVGQVVQGQVRDGITGEPVQAALVLLIDDVGTQRAGVLTGTDGRFLLRAPGPGRYTAQAERIGYQPARSETFDVDGVRGVSVVLTLAPMALELEGLHVEAQRRCAVGPEEGAAVARLWEQARVALRNQEWTDRTGSVRFRVTNYEREVDPNTGLATSEDRRTTTWMGRNPIRSLPAEELLSEGFVRPDGRGGYVYYGADAAVLLSDAFLDAHCFGLTATFDDPSAIGLTFQPLRTRRSAPGIEGTLWLGRDDARLRTLEFRYTWSPWPEASGFAGSRVDFEELPEGAWYVRRWWIRMPRMTRDLGLMSRGRSGLRVSGLVEAGGTAARLGETAQFGAGSGRGGTVHGMAWDSIRARPLAGARVWVEDEESATVTDASGRFRLEGVPAGLREIRIDHPRFDSLPVVPPAAEVTVRDDATAGAELWVPSVPSIVAAACGGTGVPEGTSLVAGVVRSAADGEPLAGATVLLEWTTYQGDIARDLLADVGSVTVTSDPRGRWVACGVPLGVRVAAHATWRDEQGPVRRTQVSWSDIAWMDLPLAVGATEIEGAELAEEVAPPDPAAAAPPCPSPWPGHGTVVGAVREQATQVPMGLATVRLMTAEEHDALETRADTTGFFAFCQVPEGAWALEGWLGDHRGGPLRVAVAPGEEAQVELALGVAVEGARTGALRGRVVDAATGAPVRVAEVEVAGTDRRVLTGEDGSFSFPSLEPGTVRLAVRCLGYAGSDGVVALAPGQLLDVEVSLSTQAIPLEPIVVTASRRALPPWAPPGLERRLVSGWGQILMEDDIQVRNPTRVTDLLVGSAVEVHDNGRLIRMRRTRCTPLVYIDGSKVAGEPGEVLRMIHPADLFAVEIYQGPAETPGQWVDSQSRCGVILLWTRRGGTP